MAESEQKQSKPTGRARVSTQAEKIEEPVIEEELVAKAPEPEATNIPKTVKVSVYNSDEGSIAVKFTLNSEPKSIMLGPRGSTELLVDKDSVVPTPRLTVLSSGI